MPKSRKYTEAFKREAVRLLETRGERSAGDVAESLGVAENLLWNWRRRFGEVTAAIREERGESPEEEVKRLRRESAEFREEREILKKAAAFFAKETRR